MVQYSLPKMICPQCGVAMNHHADKLIYADESPRSDLGASLAEFHTCPNCGHGESRVQPGFE
jgi:ribosomal protein S27AE